MEIGTLITQKKRTANMVVMICYSLFALFSLRNYIFIDSAFILAICAIPLMLMSQKRETSNRLFIPILFLVLVNVFIQTNILRYLSFALSILFLIESHYGKINSTIYAIIIIISPYLKFMHSLYSYDLREKIGKIVERLLIHIQPNTKIYGNSIFFEGQKFSIDPGCAGIQMVFVSFVIGTIFLLYLEQNKLVRFNSLEIIVSLAILFMLNLVNNFIRITFLIVFVILPENALHSIVGLLSLIAFTILPFGFLAYWYTIKFKNQYKPATDKIAHKTNTSWSYLMAMIVILVSGKPIQSNSFSNVKPLNFKNYHYSVLNEGIIKYSNNHSIMYQKPTFLFKSEHNPMVCWQGSGYDLQNIQIRNFNNHLIKVGTLISGADTLYTAWWFDNGSKTMIDQWQWRKDQFINKSKPYFLINLTTENPAELSKLIQDYNRNKSSIWNH